NPRSLPLSVSESRLLRSSSCSVFAMLTSLDFLSIVYAPNGPFVFCKPCGRVIATNPHDAGKDYPLTRKDHLLCRHLLKHHEDKGPFTSLPTIATAWPELIAA